MEKGLELTLKYAHHCDPAFLEFLVGKKKESEEQIRERLKTGSEGERKFLRFYKKILEENGRKDVYDIDIVRLYWEANPTLRGFPDLTHNFFLINEYFEKDIRKVGKLALYELNECMVHPADVKEVKDENVVISQKFVSKKGNLLSVSHDYLEITIKNVLELKIEAGDMISVHHFHPVAKITNKDRENLLESIRKGVETYNKK